MIPALKVKSKIQLTKGEFISVHIVHIILADFAEIVHLIIWFLKYTCDDPGGEIKGIDVIV